jgi:hypothetical protein
MFPSPGVDSINYASIHNEDVNYTDGSLVISCNVNDRKLKANPGLRVPVLADIGPGVEATISLPDLRLKILCPASG